MSRMPAVWSAVAALFLANACSSSPPPEWTRTEAALRVLEAYDLSAMLGHVAPVINDSLTANLPAEVDAAERARLRETVIRVYDPGQLAADIARRLRERAEAADRRDVLLEAAEMLETRLAREMIAYEQSAASEEFAEGFRRFLDQPIRPGDESRLGLARDLVAQMRLVELQVEFNVAMLYGAVAAHNAAVPGDRRTPETSLRHMENQTRDHLRRRLGRQLPVMLFYAYREVDDGTLNGYARIQTSPSLRWVNETLPEVLAQSLLTAAKRFSSHYRAATP